MHGGCPRIAARFESQRIKKWRKWLSRGLPKTFCLSHRDIAVAERVDSTPSQTSDIQSRALPDSTMVVVHAQPSTSTASHKKNRRKLRKHSTKIQDVEMKEDELHPATDEHGIADVQDDDEVMIDKDESVIAADSAAPAFPEIGRAHV